MLDYLRIIILMAVSTALINNMIFHYFVGLCPFIGVSRRVDMAFGMGMAVMFVVTVAASLSWTVTYYITSPGAPLSQAIYNLVYPGSTTLVDLSILNYVVYIFLIASAVQLVEMYVRKFFPPLYKAFGVFLPLITTNCLILFVCLEVAKHIGPEVARDALWRLDHTMIYAITAGLGFTIAIVIMAGIREELDHADVPRALRGPGITLVITGILALAFMGLLGMDRKLADLFAKPAENTATRLVASPDAAGQPNPAARAANQDAK
ncbi:MAG: Na(+)-translocating NADH-quinone reductase subunit E [Planctomycetes bacterium ADurb.Bin126]|nr:MAG: Na(+)-translocating NADH-quinone reductase subunit E [Planctomycetes bacterium ADurb.Bin126]HOD81038.1 Rnf-Nqr domain containing protein [Phycisphaerae bacterium]HQL75670.1 Rnf-Nqr domain containing protein [Phycisphaerae bacterium]